MLDNGPISADVTTLILVGKCSKIKWQYIYVISTFSFINQIKKKQETRYADILLVKLCKGRRARSVNIDRVFAMIACEAWNRFNIVLLKDLAQSQRYGIGV